ncbi:MAG: efflux RND transporter permease subunit [Gemmatimonadetes bacterium]|nr:efflux RND transporter permease subunit [Gemmatimonadota bacterium]
MSEPSAGKAGRRVPAARDERSFKEFPLTTLAIRNRTSVLVLFAFVTIGGLVSYNAIPKESFPEIEIPSIAVNTFYPGVSPTDVESLVTRKIEEELNTISGLKELTSTSIEGYSSVVAEFETSTNMDEALQKVREKVDLARPELPPDADDPAIYEFNVDDFPMMQVNLAGAYGLVRLKEVGEDLQDRLEAIPAVLRVDLRGGLEREVRVDVDLSRLQYYNVSFDDVLTAIREENVNIPGGSIDVGGVKYLVRVDGEFDDPSLVGDLVVTTVDGRPIYVSDLAEVEFGFAERESYARLSDEPVITLDVVKRSGRNIIETADAVRAEIDAMRPFLPPSTIVSITSDMSADIGDMVSSLQNNIISGLILIVGVLLFVLGLRTSIFVAISIPTSMFLTFVLLRVLGVSMNMVVLFSLILALGMLVDNAIVIVENIYRFVEEGWDRRTAARKATGEVAVPVVAATATTLAAFTPLLFWPGLAGQFMRYLPLTLIVTLSSSLFVALVIVPTLCSFFLDPAGARPRRQGRRRRGPILGILGVGLLLVGLANPLTAVLLAVVGGGLWLLHVRVLERVGAAFMAHTYVRLISWYEGRLSWALDHRPLVLFGSVAAFVGTIVVYGLFARPVEYFPEDVPPRTLVVSVDAPVGTSADVTDGYARRLKADLAGIEGLSDAETVVTTVGAGGGGGGFMASGPSGPEAGRITVDMVEPQDRSHDVFATLAEMQRRVGAELAGAEVRVDKVEEGPGSGPPVNIEIGGEDPQLLAAFAEEAINLIEGAPVYSRLVGLESDMDDARAELQVEVDRERASLYGLSTNDVGFAVRGAINGLEAAKYRTGNDEFDIVVRLREEDRRELTALDELTALAEGTQVPLVSVAEWRVGKGYGSIRRKDMDRVATVSAEVTSGQNPNAVLGEVRGVLADFAASLPPGYTLAFTGEQEEQQEAQAFLMGAFLIAVGLIAFILVSQFNSVVKPLIILSSVVMSTIGVLVGLLVFKMPFVIIMTGVGVISLAGVVVNNAIVLIDYIDVLRRRDGLSCRDAVTMGGITRLRPVLLTAITTALGLVPLAIGLNFDFFGFFSSLAPEIYWGGEQAAWWSPMAVAVIVGIIFATFLTLILVPVLYTLADDLASFVSSKLSSPPTASR